MTIKDYPTDSSTAEVALEPDISKSLRYYNTDKKGIPIDLVLKVRINRYLLVRGKDGQ